MRKFLPIFLVLMVFIFSFSSFSSAKNLKKIVLINSYHQGYPWSDGIIKGVRSAFAKHEPVLFKLINMDTKRNASEWFKKQAGVKAKEEINKFKPDVIIAADDNASKYVIVPYFKGKSIPVVFCGVNWDASVYGFPAKNVTGMVEISLTDKLIKTMKKFSKGSKIGFLGADNLSNRKEAKAYKSTLNIEVTEEIFVNTVEEWKQAFLVIQKNVDILVLLPPSFFVDYENKKELKYFIYDNTVIPTGCVEEWIVPYAFIGLTKVAEEQGLWSAKTVIEILKGRKPSKIPIVRNKDGKMIVNDILRRKLNIDITDLDLEEIHYINAQKY